MVRSIHLALVSARLILPAGGFPIFVKNGHNENYLPVWLQDAGYKTFYAGKMFNAHTIWNYDSPHLKGWTGSVGFI